MAAAVDEARALAEVDAELALDEVFALDAPAPRRPHVRWMPALDVIVRFRDGERVVFLVLRWS